MLQQQISEYAKAQLGLGISEEVIRSALVDAGWTVQDVDDSIKSVAQKNAMEAAHPAFSTPVFKTGTQPSSSSSQSINLNNLFGGGGKNEVSFAATADLSKAKISEASTEAASIVSSKKVDTQKFSNQKAQGISKIVEIAVAVVALASTVAAIFLYVSNNKLADQVDTLSTDSAAARSSSETLSAQLTSLTASKQDVDKKLNEALKEMEQLHSELSFFVAQDAVSGDGAVTVQQVAFSLRGALAIDDKLQYSLTSSNGLNVFIKNSKAQKVDSALRPLIGEQIEISGTHAPLSRDVTVSAVNGTSL
ncbi:MAG: hypothetical protein AAB602_01465 [Patescibacteria group bacterium]